ncbi:helix-turn-helix domain-containing protein [Funiculus sociatus]|uniref:helix-turn-helix domain-containing protein n=1 Tax=Funiculus sociatus TaxID=450527 RepID=UPI00329988E7
MRILHFAVPHSYKNRYRAFVKRLKLSRIEAELTQVEAAEKLKISQSYISKCKSGERRVDFIELLDFARINNKA